MLLINDFKLFISLFVLCSISMVILMLICLFVCLFIYVFTFNDNAGFDTFLSQFCCSKIQIFYL